MTHATSPPPDNFTIGELASILEQLGHWDPHDAIEWLMLNRRETRARRARCRAGAEAVLELLESADFEALQRDWR